MRTLLMGSKSDQVKKLIDASFLNNRTKRSYLQTYQLKLKDLGNEKFRRLKIIYTLFLRSLLIFCACFCQLSKFHYIAPIIIIK